MGEWTLPNPTDERALAKPPRFVWPPRKPPVEVPAHQPIAPRKEHPSDSQDGVYQDRPRPRQPAPLPPPRLLGSPIARAWSDIERTWLDVVAPPLAQRMAEEYWSPDSPTDYCPRCAATVGKHEAVDMLCSECQSGITTRPPWQRIVRLGEYEAPLNRWICEVKFTRWRKLGRDLGRVLGESIQTQIAQARAVGTIPDGPPLIVPVPMSVWRRFSRGMDHTLAIARGVADTTGGMVAQPLTRDHRPSQTHVAPSRREANVAGTIHPKPAWRRARIGERLVIVLDDVTTTSSTLRGACRAVAECVRSEQQKINARTKGKPAHIWGAVLARTGPDVHDLTSDGYPQP